MEVNDSGNEYSHSQVPDSATVAWWKIAVIKIGVVIALPAFVSGAEIGSLMGLRRGMLAIFIGASVLAILAAFTGAIAARSHLTTALIARHAFGDKGARVVGIVLAATLLCWFGVTAELFGQSLRRISDDFFGLGISAAPYIIVGGGLMVMTTIYGFKALQRLADWAVPVLLIGLVGMAYYGVRQAAPGVLDAAPAHSPPLGYGISAVIGSLAAGITIFPDVARFARSPNHARGAAIVTYAFSLPAVLLLAAIPSIATGERDLIAIMTGLGLGIPAFVFLLLTAWTTNSGNLYSATLGISTSLPRLSFKALTLILGVIGIAFSLSGASESLIPLFVLISATIPPVAGIYIADFFVIRRGRYEDGASTMRIAYSPPAFMAWAAAAAVGICAARGLFAITGVPALDAIAVAFAGYTALARVRCLSARHRFLPRKTA